MLFWTPICEKMPTEDGWYFVKMTTINNGWEITETLPAKLTVSGGELEWDIHGDDCYGVVISFTGTHWENHWQDSYRRNRETVYVDCYISYDITHWAQVVFGG